MLQCGIRYNMMQYDIQYDISLQYDIFTIFRKLCYMRHIFVFPHFGILVSIPAISCVETIFREEYLAVKWILVYSWTYAIRIFKGFKIFV